MVQMRFDYRDIFRSPRLAFSLQRVWIQFVGMGVGYIGYLILTYVSLLTAGASLPTSWEKYGLLPCLYAAGGSFPWYAWIVFAIGCLFLVAAYLVTSTAVSRAVYMMLKGNNFYTWREAFKVAFKKIGSTLMTPVAMIILILCFVIGAWVVGLLGRIPYVGWLGLSLFTFFWMAAALFLFFLAIVFGVSLILVPAILATTDEDAFEAVFQTFSSAWGQPWRFVLYEFMTVALTLVSFGILAFAVKRAFFIMKALFAFAMGDKFINLAAHGMYLLQKWVLLSQDLITSLFGPVAPAIYFVREFYPLELSPVLTISAYLFAISMVIVGGWVLAYGLSTFNVGNTLTYLVMRKKKDDENLLERKDKEEEEEKKEEPAEKKEEEKEEEVKAEAKAEAKEPEAKKEEPGKPE